MRTVGRIADLRAAVGAARRDGRRVGLVPTMGALHDGHLSLVRRARQDSDHVVVSVFVNPLQFGPGEDYQAYPRDLDRDRAGLAALDGDAPDLVFAPEVDEVYPRPVLTTVSVAELTERLCGASRPGHFDGVTTVVAKLFNLAQPDVAFFGRKDFQQLQVIRRMVDDLDLPVEVVGCPTVREPDGLARSSRNAYLAPHERRAALRLSRALRAAVLAARDARAAGAPPAPGGIREAARGILTAESDLRVDYVEVVDLDTLAPPDQRGEVAGPVGTEGGSDQLLVALAAFVGPARLIDNVVVGDREDEERLLAATADGGE